MARARIRGAACVYEEFGAGPPVVLVHSIGLSTREGWREQVPVLAGTNRVVTYDIRGLGESEAGSEPLSVETFARDLAALCDHLGIGRPILMGVSLGGFIAQAFASTDPGRPRALVLVSTACRIAEGNAGARAERNRRIREGGMAAWADRQIETHFSAPFRHANPDTMAWYRRHYLANDAERYIAVMEDLGRFDGCAELSRIACPALVIAGAEDRSAVAGSVPGESARALAERIPGARLEIIAGAHHYPQIEAADAFNRIVTGFLSGLGNE